MRKYCWIIFPLILSGCDYGYNMHSVRYDNLFHDSNSKVWVINRHIVDSVNIAPYNFADKQLLIFYASSKFYVIPVKGLGKSQPTKGTYYIDSDEKRIDLYLPGRVWSMKMPYITEDSILMRHTEKSDIKQDIQIIPFPEY